MRKWTDSDNENRRREFLRTGRIRVGTFEEEVERMLASVPRRAEEAYRRAMEQRNR